MNHLPNLFVNLVLTSFLGIFSLLISYLLVVDAIPGNGFFVYVVIIGFLNAFIAGATHLFIYLPIITINTRDNKPDVILPNLSTALTILFLVVLFVIFLTSVGERIDMSVFIFTAATLFASHCFGAILLTNRIKESTHEKV